MKICQIWTRLSDEKLWWFDFNGLHNLHGTSVSGYFEGEELFDGEITFLNNEKSSEIDNNTH